LDLKERLQSYFQRRLLVFEKIIENYREIQIIGEIIIYYKKIYYFGD
jgi:hypothetical protein